MSAGRVNASKILGEKRNRLHSHPHRRPLCLEHLEGRRLLSFTGSLLSISGAAYFDFGTAASTLAPGYIKATSSTAYSSTLGYGWSSGIIGERDRGKPAWSDQSAFNFTTNGTFSVDLPNGTYVVTLTSGDSLDMHDQEGVFLQGSQVDTISTRAGQFVTRAYIARVTDGRLVLGLKDLGGLDPNCMINSLQIQFASSSTSGSTSARNFDFGTTTSTLTPGYTRTTSLTAYSSVLGYGWSSGTIGERDRGKPAWSDQSAFNFTTNGTFSVDLANGIYAVTLTSGDSLAMHDQEGIFLQGSQVDTISTAMDQFVTRTYIARVTGGRLVLGLKDLGGLDPNCMINSLQIQFVSGNPSDRNFDFGTATSTLTPGYIKATSSTTYSPALGYGWSSGTIGERDRGKPVGSDQSAFNFTTSGAFAVDLDNGTYTVTVTLGDSLVMHDLQGIFLQGEQVDTISTAINQFVTRTYTAQVIDGQLVLGLVDLGGTDPNCMINSLQIHFVSSSTAGSTGARNFDFGTAASFLTPGYTKATSSTAYSTALGYGWSSGTVGERNRGKPAGSDQSAFNFTTDATFAVDLANGTYAVTLTTGDLLVMHDLQGIFLQGEQVDTISTRVNQFVTRTYIARVTGGRLVLGLVDLGGTDPNCVINSLQIQFVSGSTSSSTIAYDYDFGTAASTLTPGYNRTTSSTAYSSALGYGWSSGTIGERDRGKPAWSDQSAFNFTTNGTFEVDLPNGTYAVTLTSGDSLAMHDQEGIFLQGSQVDTISTRAGQFVTRTYAARVTDGRLVLGLVDMGGLDLNCVINSLQIQLVSGRTVQIDQSWLQQRGAGPYYLDQANTTYVLQTDVTVDGTAFIILNQNITFDLNGHTITYDNSQPITVPNGGFESGSSPTDIPNWDVSQAPGAVRVPARTGMWGSWMLQIPNVTTTESITSGKIAIPRAYVEYTALVTPQTSVYGGTVTLSVVDAVTGAVLGSSNSADPNRGFSPVVSFVPTSTNPVLLKVVMTAPSGQSMTLNLDYASVTRSRNFGIVATPSYWYLPASLQTDYVVASASSEVNAAVKNGSIMQGSGNSYSGSAVFAKGSTKTTIDGVRATVSGADANILDLYYANNVVVSNSTLMGKEDRISDRMLSLAAIQLLESTGTITLTGNTITGTMDAGIVIYKAGSDANRVLIQNNTITQNTLATDGYGLVLNNLKNFDIGRNTISPVNGRGILFDGINNGQTQDGVIHDNTVSAVEHANLEFGATAMEATALRMRNYTGSTFKNLTFSNNVFSATTGSGLDWAATGARLTLKNPTGEMKNAGLVFQGNTFRAILTSPIPNLTGLQEGGRAWGLTFSQVDAGTGTTFIGNTFDSNDVSLNFGDNDGYGLQVADLLFLGNTINKSSAGASSSYDAIVAGDWQTSVTNIRLIDTKYTNGATAVAAFTGPLAKNISFGSTTNLTVLDASGKPVTGAVVTIYDQNNTRVFSGTTAADGKLNGIPIVTTTYSVAAGADNSKPVTTSKSLFTIKASSGAQSGSLSTTISQNQNLIVRVK